MIVENELWLLLDPDTLKNFYLENINQEAYHYVYLVNGTQLVSIKFNWFVLDIIVERRHCIIGLFLFLQYIFRYLILMLELHVFFFFIIYVLKISVLSKLWNFCWRYLSTILHCSLRMYNTLVEKCFTDCVDSFRRKTLDKQEETCVRRCAEKFLKHSMRVGLRFAELNQGAATQD